jgi:hypothetical protein
VCARTRARTRVKGINISTRADDCRVRCGNCRRLLADSNVSFTQLSGDTLRLIDTRQSQLTYNVVIGAVGAVISNGDFRYRGSEVHTETDCEVVSEQQSP